jgi:thiol-disulfide isomerase/thioredoxin
MADPPQRGRRPAPRPGARYVGFVGLAFLVLIAIATYNTIRTASGGLLGVDAAVRGRPLPEFAVPNIRGGPNADANIYQDDCATSSNPCPADERRVPACRIPPHGAIRVCDLFDRPLVISFWFSRGGNCEDQQDVVSRVSRRYRGRVNFLSIDIRDSRDSVRDLVRERGWRMPVGYDHDGAVAGLYRVGGCPTIVYAYPGGILQSASVGELVPSQLTAKVDALLAATRRKQGTSH